MHILIARDGALYSTHGESWFSASTLYGHGRFDSLASLMSNSGMPAFGSEEKLSPSTTVVGTY